MGLNRGTRALIIRTAENFLFRNLDIWDMGILAMMIESVSSIILNDGRRIFVYIFASLTYAHNSVSDDPPAPPPPLSNLVRINGHGVCEFSHMLMRKNVTNDVRKN